MARDLTHADLERYHYEAVRNNPQYRLAGMLDVEMEWLAMNMPPQFDASDIEDRLSNLEEISAQSGGIPRAYQESLTQLQGQVVFLQNKLNAALDRGKEKAKQQATKQQKEKPRYGGLSGKH
jgi:hypothetical protein